MEPSLPNSAGGRPAKHEATEVRAAPSRGRHDARGDIVWTPRIAAGVVLICLAVLLGVGVAVVFPLRADESAGESPLVAPRDLEWACPTERPYKFTDTFGAPRSGDRLHKGTDVFAEKGSPAHAVVGGEVTKAVPTDDGTLGGARVWIAGDDGWWYYYAHLDTVDVEVGDSVRTGAQIGTVGNTGNAASTPSHIHIEMHFRSMTGPYVNPHAVLSDVC